MPGGLRVNYGSEAFPVRCPFEPSGVQKPAVGPAGEAGGASRWDRPGRLIRIVSFGRSCLDLRMTNKVLHEPGFGAIDLFIIALVGFISSHNNLN
jgi:hypothetical protein